MLLSFVRFQSDYKGSTMPLLFRLLPLLPILKRGTRLRCFRLPLHQRANFAPSYVALIYGWDEVNERVHK